MIIDDHLKVKNIVDLKEYLENHIPKKEFADFEIETEKKKESGWIRCDAESGSFNIRYDKDKNVKLDIYGNSEFVHRVRSLITAVMWQYPGCVSVPLYIEHGKDEFEHVYDWAITNRFEVLQMLASEVYEMGLNSNTIEINYPGISSEEDFAGLMKYGNCVLAFNVGERAKVDNANEFGLFCIIDKYVVDLMANKAMEKQNENEAIVYKLAYACQRLKDFGVEVEEPAFDEYKLSSDTIAYIMWWKVNREKVINKYKEDYDKSIENNTPFEHKPDGSYKDMVAKLTTLSKNKKYTAFLACLNDLHSMCNDLEDEFYF